MTDFTTKVIKKAGMLTRLRCLFCIKYTQVEAVTNNTVIINRFVLLKGGPLSLDMLILTALNPENLFEEFEETGPVGNA